MSDGVDVSESIVDGSSQRMSHQLPKRAVAPAAVSSSHLSILAAQSPFDHYPENLLPFPLNLPPSYPVYRNQALALLQRQPSTISSPGASGTADRTVKNASRTTTPAPVESMARPEITVSSASKGKRSLDAFMQSRQAAQSLTESSDSDSDTSLRKVLVNRWQALQSSESTRIMSTSPPSSSPVQTPRASSPVHPTLPGNLTEFHLSPSPRPKRQVMINARAGSSSRPSMNEVPYTLPPGPYSEERPPWSLAALIGQAISASFACALPLNDIYTYISTVYPYFDRRDQAWMSSIRHSLSVNEAFERVYDQDGTAAKRVKCKGKTRLKGGFWRIRPGFEECFLNGNFVRRGAKGAGPGMNPSSRKRGREEDSSQRSQKPKTGRSVHNRSNSNIESTMTARMNSRMRSQSSPEPVAREFAPPISSSPPPLSASQSTYPSDNLLSDTCDSTSPVPPNPLGSRKKFQYEPTNILAKLEAGFELQNPLDPTDADDPVKIIHPSSVSFPAASLLPFKPDTSSRCRTPPHQSLTPSRTPISYQGIQMSPSLSLAHYKNSLEPEWKAVMRSSTPPAVSGGSNSAPFATPQRFIFPRPLQTPSKHYDPYDPETLLADELAIARKSRELGESPGGIFGREGRKLLYESPSVPGKSDWRFIHDEF